MRIHANLECLHSFQKYPGIKRAHGGAGDTQKLEHTFHIFLATQHCSAQHTSLSVEILGGGMNHNVRTEIQRTLQDRRAETVVHHQQRTAAFCHGCYRRHVGHLGERIRRRFQKQHSGVGLDRRLPLGRTGCRHIGRINAKFLDHVIK